MDASDIINSWQGYSVLGYSEIEARSLKEKLLFFRKKDSMSVLDPTIRCYTVVRNALGVGLSARCDPALGQKGLILISGPPASINIEGFSQSRTWLEEIVGGHEVRGGDYPITKGNRLRAVVLISGFPDLPRFQQLQERAMGTTPKPTPVEKGPAQA